MLAVFNILAGLLIYIIARHAFDAKQALFALLLFLANPLTISAVYIGYCDNFVVFFILLSIYMLIRERPLLAGAALAVAFMSKPFPVLFLFVITPYYLKEHRQHFLFKFLLAFFLAVLVISAPFLLLCPWEFLRYAFLFNFERYPDSLSLYFYYLPWLQDGILPVVFQAVFTAWLSYSIFKSQKKGLTFLLLSSLFLFLSFITLNRINYPHYLIYIVPFFTIVLVESYLLKNRFSTFLLWKQLVISISVTMLGGLIWAYGWTQGAYDFKSSIYFWIGSAIYFTGCFYLMALLYIELNSFKSERQWSSI